MTLLKCNYLIFTNLFFCYCHSYCYNLKKSGKILHLFTFFSITSHCFSLFLVDSKSMLTLLPFKATTITPRHSKCFHMASGAWFANLAFAHHINSWCATRNPVPDSTYHLADLKSVTMESQNISPCMTATPWRRVNWKMCDENLTFACFDAICTQFNATWPHCGTVRDFLAVLTDPDCRHESDFLQRDDSDSTCGRRVHAVQNKSPEQTSACLPAYMALHKIAGYKRF